MEKRSDRRDPETGDKWLILIIFCLVTMLDFGMIFAFGAMFVAMMDSYQSDRSTTATVQSLLVGVSLSFSVLSGALVSKFGLFPVTFVSAILVPFGFCVSFFISRVSYLYLTVSIISGVGISSLHLANIIVIERYFKHEQHPVCFAIQGVGVNVAGVLYPLLIEQLLSKYGVQGTFLVLGGIFLNSLSAPWMLFLKAQREVPTRKEFFEQETEANAMLAVRSDGETANDYLPKEVSNIQDKFRKCLNSSVFSKMYICLLVASALSIPSLNTFLGLTVDIFVWKGFTVSEGLFSFVPFNIVSILSKFVPVAAKLTHISAFTVPVLFCFCGLLGQILVYFGSSFAVMLTGTGLSGLSQGAFPALLIVAAKVLSPEEWPVASGLLVTIIGLVTAGLGPAFGDLRDKTGSYSDPVVIMATLQGIGGILYTVAFCMRKFRKRPREQVVVHVDI